MAATAGKLPVDRAIQQKGNRMNDDDLLNLVLTNNANGPSATQFANGLGQGGAGAGSPPLSSLFSTGLGGDVIASMLPQLGDTSAPSAFLRPLLQAYRRATRRCHPCSPPALAATSSRRCCRGAATRTPHCRLPAPARRFSTSFASVILCVVRPQSASADHGPTGCDAWCAAGSRRGDRRSGKKASHL